MSKVKKYEVLKDILVYDRGTGRDPRFTFKEPDKYLYLLEFKKGENYIGADRTEIGLFLIQHGYLKELENKS